MRVERNLKLMAGFTIGANAMCVLGVIVPYYRDVMGLDFQAFLIGEAVFAAVVLLCEVPMGWISDQWQRRHVLALGVLCEIIGFACMLVGDNLWWAMLSQGVIGVGISLTSGTNTAMIYDSLLSAGRESEFRRHEGKRAALGFYSVASASVISGFVFAYDKHLPVVLTIAALAVAAVCACLMDEPERHRAKVERHPLADMAATAHYALRGHAEVGLIILFASALFCATKLIMWAQQPYYMAIGLHESLFGMLMAAGFLMAGVSSHLGHKLDGRAGGLRMLALCWLVALCVCVTTGLYQGLAGVGLLMIGGSCLFGLASPRVSEAINARVDSARRATVLSTQSLVASLFFIPTSLTLGWLDSRHGVGGALLGIAAWLVLAGGLLSLLLVNGDRRRKLMLL